MPDNLPIDVSKLDLDAWFRVAGDFLSIIKEAVKRAPVTDRKDVQANANALHTIIEQIKAHDAALAQEGEQENS